MATPIGPRSVPPESNESKSLLSRLGDKLSKVTRGREVKVKGDDDIPKLDPELMLEEISLQDGRAPPVAKTRVKTEAKIATESVKGGLIEKIKSTAMAVKGFLFPSTDLKQEKLAMAVNVAYGKLAKANAKLEKLMKEAPNISLEKLMSALDKVEDLETEYIVATDELREFLLKSIAKSESKLQNDTSNVDLLETYKTLKEQDDLDRMLGHLADLKRQFPLHAAEYSLWEKHVGRIVNFTAIIDAKIGIESPVKQKIFQEAKILVNERLQWISDEASLSGPLVSKTVKAEIQARRAPAINKQAAIALIKERIDIVRAGDADLEIANEYLQGIQENKPIESLEKILLDNLKEHYETLTSPNSLLKKEIAQRWGSSVDDATINREILRALLGPSVKPSTLERISKMVVKSEPVYLQPKDHGIFMEEPIHYLRTQIRVMRNGNDELAVAGQRLIGFTGKTPPNPITERPVLEQVFKKYRELSNPNGEFKREVMQRSPGPILDAILDPEILYALLAPVTKDTLQAVTQWIMKHPEE